MKRILILTPAILLLELLVFYCLERPVVEAANLQTGADESIQSLKLRIQKLEEQTAAMQKRLDSLESRPESRMPYAPCPPSRMPPGSRPFEFNGMEFWMMPVHPDGQAQPMDLKMPLKNGGIAN